ncbi:MAG: hypothetical protein U9N19_04615 [Thermodesulfobacteriota bacterium]|nr:hypothetical protein [Thermodesulfobacteriota bacterium]
MTKTELINQITEDADLTKADAQRALNKLNQMVYLFFIVFIITLGCSAVTMAEELILKTQPLSESEKLVSLEIFSELKLRGDVTSRITESKVTLGRGHTSFIPTSTPISSQQIITPDRSIWDLYLIHIPFTIHEPPEDSYYHKVKFKIDLANPDISAFDLLPKNVTSKVEVTKTYILSPQLTFKEVEGRVGELGYKVRFDSLRPIISAFGIGEHKFYWVYTSQDNQKLLPGTRHVLVVLQAPKKIDSIYAMISYEVVIVKKLFGQWRSSDAITDSYLMKRNLAGAKSL